jgi:hypothetical protein
VADTYTVRVQYPTVEFLGGSQTRDVMAIGFVTKPHGIYFEARIPKKQYNAAAVRSYGIGYSGMIEAIADIAGIEAMVYSPKQQPDGTLLDTFEVYVSSTSGDSAGALTLRFDELVEVFAGPKVKALRKQLDDAEAS